MSHYQYTIQNQLLLSKRKVKKLSKKKDSLNQTTNNAKQDHSNLNKDLYKLFQELHQKTEKEIQVLIQMNENTKDPDINQKTSSLVQTITQKINYEKHELIQKLYHAYFTNQKIDQNMFHELKKDICIMFEKFHEDIYSIFKAHHSKLFQHLNETLEKRQKLYFGS